MRVVARVEHFTAEAHAALVRELSTRRIIPRCEPSGVEFRLNGVEVRILTREPNLRAYFTAQVRDFVPEIILASTDDAAHLMLEVALRAACARVVYLVRATIALPFGPDSGLPSEFLAGALRQTDGVVAVSEYVAQYTRKWGAVEAVHLPISLLDPGIPARLGRFENRFRQHGESVRRKRHLDLSGAGRAFPARRVCSGSHLGNHSRRFPGTARAAERLHSAAGG